MPEIIITPQELEEHKIEKYSFRTVNSRGLLSGEGNVEVTNRAEAFSLKAMDISSPPKKPHENDEKEGGDGETKKSSQDPDTQKEQIEKFNPPVLEDKTKEISKEVERVTSQNEELLKRIDDLTSQVIKLEMDSEKKEEEFSESLDETKESSFNEGLEKGKEAAQEKFQDEMATVFTQLQSSVKKLDESAFMYENGLKSLEGELITVALDIAKEVIAKEISKESSKVAISLASTLLKEVKDASEITIRVSPVDSDNLRESFKNNKKIKIESDSAVSQGGVIILSDIGNINGDIHTRYEQLKKHTLENE